MLEKIRAKYQLMPLPAKAGVWFTICSIVQRGISVLSMPIFTRMLSTEAYGTYSLYTSWNMLFALIITLNLASEVFNKGLIDYEDERAAYSMSQASLVTVIVMMFYLLYLALSSPINALTGMDTLLTSFMFVDIYTTTIVGLWFARKRFDYAYKQLMAVTLAISVASVALGILCVWIAPDEWKVVARVASNVAPSAIMTVFVIVGFLKRSSTVLNRLWWCQSVKMGVPLVPHYASQVLLNQADKIIISWFLGNAKVAIYGVAHSAGLLLVMINNGINSSFVPWLYGKLKSGEVGPIAGVANALSVAVLFLVFLLMLLAPECVALLAAPEYAEAIWCVPPIATGVVFSFIYTLFVNIEIYYGKASYVAIASIASAVLNIVLNLVAVPVFGYVASAYVTAACYLATAMLHYSFMKRTLRDAGTKGRVYDGRFLLLVCIATLVCMVVSVLLYVAGPFRYAFVALFLIAGFLLRSRLIEALKTIRKKA